MYQKKLYSLLQTLTTSELTQLGKFLKSPYHNNSKLIIRLFEIIKRHHPKYESRSLVREKLFAKLFPSKSYQLKKISDLLSDLNLHTEKFLMIEALEKKTIIKDALKNQVYEERLLGQHFLQHIKKSTNRLVGKNPKTPTDYYNLMELYSKQYYHLRTQRLDDNRAEIQLAMESLDRFFILMKLRLGMELYSRKSMIPEDTEIWLSEDVIKEAKKYESENPLFYLFPRNMKLLQGHLNREELLQMIEFIGIRETNVLDSEIKLTAIFMINKLLQIYYSGEEEFIHILFATYKALLQKESILMDYGKMRHSTFNNIVVTGCITKEFKCVKKFMQEYTRRLLDEDKVVTINYCKSMINFHQEEYESALGILSGVHPIKKTVELRVSFLRIRILYELYLKDDSYSTTHDSIISSFLNLLNKASFFTEDRKDLYRRTIAWIKRLKPLKYKKVTKTQKEQMIDELNTSQLIAKNWIRNKIKEL